MQAALARRTTNTGGRSTAILASSGTLFAGWVLLEAAWKLSVRVRDAAVLQQRGGELGEWLCAVGMLAACIWKLPAHSFQPSKSREGAVGMTGRRIRDDMVLRAQKIG